MKKRYCNRCGHEVVETAENELDYPWYCPECDENMYDFETHDGVPNEPVKVYVCEIEMPDIGTREVVAVFSTLEEAQEKMRIEYDGYLDNGGAKDQIEWYSGDGGKWGWYNTCCQHGFYVTEIELDKWHK